MSNLNLFVPITKVDVARREVWGRLAHEIPDRTDEIFDYESSKPYFKEWSDEFAKATDGKSLGNMRAMHGRVAAGKFIAVNFNDTDKAIDVGGKVVDENEWNKVLEGVYTGFSIGGSYVGEKKTEKIDGKEFKRYTAKPAEGSLVDSPCIPTAKFFDIVKADGVIEKKAFKPPEFEVQGTDEQVGQFAKLLQDKQLSMADVIGMLEKFKGKEAEAHQDEGDGDEEETEPEHETELHENPHDHAIAEHAHGKTAAAMESNKADHHAEAAHAHRAAEAHFDGKGDEEQSDHHAAMASYHEHMASHKFVEAAGMLKQMLAKPLIESESDEARSKNIAAEIRSGKSKEQAAAIAYSVQREAKKKKQKKDDAATDMQKNEVAQLLDKLEGLLGMNKVVHKERIQAIHDHTTSMGADCSGAKAAPIDELSKRDDTIKQLEERIKKLEAQPMPFVTLRAVAKTVAVPPPSVPVEIPELPSLEKDDYIYLFKGGPVDWATSYAIKRQKLAAAASSASNS